MVIANEVGAIATNLNGEPSHILGQDSFIVARPGLHEDILTNYIRSKKIKTVKRTGNRFTLTAFYW